MSNVLLNEETAMAIYGLRDSDHHEVAKKYGISYHTVKDVWSGKTWSKVTGHTRVRMRDVPKFNPFMPPIQEIIIEEKVTAVLIDDSETGILITTKSARDIILGKVTNKVVECDFDGNPTEEESFMMSINPEEAKHLLEISRYDKQRPIRVSNIVKYAADMDHDKFGVTTIEMGRFDDTLFLLNGQTRLAAIVRSGKTIRFNVLVHPGKSIEDFSDLYAEMDSGALRSYADTARSEPKFGEAGLTETQSNKLMAAVKPIIVGFRSESTDKHHSVYRVRSRTYRRDVAISFANEAVLYHAAISGGSKMLNVVLQRAGLVAVALLTIRFQPTKALKFWEEIAKADSLGAKSPQMRLVEELVSASKENSRWSYQAMFSRRIACCWNAYFLGKTRLVAIKAVESTPYIRIEGTPYTGKKAIELDDKGRFADVTPLTVV